jgi:hypothetical protein
VSLHRFPAKGQKNFPNEILSIVAFSILANNLNAPSSEIRGVIDKIALMLAQ